MEEPRTKKGGRPPKATREKKSFKVELRLTEADFNQLEKQYQNSGYRNRSDMYHDILFHKTLKQKDSATLEMLKEVQDLTREIKAIGADYHQVVQEVRRSGDNGKAGSELLKLVDLTTDMQEKEQQFFQIIIKLREKWLREL